MLLHKRRLLPVIAWSVKILLGICIVAFIVGIAAFYKLSASYRLTPQWMWNITIGDTHLLKQQDGRTNIVLLGIGGVNHEGGDLTDTIMVVSTDLKTKEVVLISIPRDVWIPTLKDKINSAYQYGEEKAKGGGLILAKSSVEEVVGIPIHYIALLDFSGFKQIIDVVGGVDVQIHESFTDLKYPIAGKEQDECSGDREFKCRYEMVVFKQGLEHMNGDRALQYVRSRFAQDDNGTDFARGKRQQAVVLALKQKLFDSSTWTNIQKLQSLYLAIDVATTTDMYLGESLLLARTLRNKITVRSVGLTQDEPEKDKKGLLINPPQWKYDGLWVLVPKAEDNFDRIKEYIACTLKNTTSCESLMD